MKGDSRSGHPDGASSARSCASYFPPSLGRHGHAHCIQPIKISHRTTHHMQHAFDACVQISTKVWSHDGLTTSAHDDTTVNEYVSFTMWRTGSTGSCTSRHCRLQQRPRPCNQQTADETLGSGADETLGSGSGGREGGGRGGGASAATAAAGSKNAAASEAP
eukprot:355217-Chlamydomonas_euryale.AAC.2